MNPEANTTNPATAEDEAAFRKKRKKNYEQKDEDLSEEELAWKQQMELYVETVGDPDPGLQKVSLESMRQEIRMSTSSMTSVPKSLNFLRPHYPALKAYYETMPQSDMKVGLVDLLVKNVDKTNFKRTCLYLTSSARYLPGPDGVSVLDIAYTLYIKFEEFPSALKIALYLDNMQYVKQVFTSCPDLLQMKQFCYNLARQGISYELDEEMCADDEDNEAALRKYQKKIHEQKDEDIYDSDLVQKQYVERCAEDIFSAFGLLKDEGKIEKHELDFRKVLADVLRGMSAKRKREFLKSHLLVGGDLGRLGHIYVRVLAGAIEQDYSKRAREEVIPDDVIQLVEQIVAFYMKHNAEPEAVDFLMEVGLLDLLVKHVDKTNFKRTCLYLTSSARFLPGPDDVSVLDIAYTLYSKFEEIPSALLTAICLGNMQYVKQIFTSCPDLLRKKQFCYILARQGISYELDEEMCADDEDRETLQEIVNTGPKSFERKAW